jgi:hypothetical protein
MARNFSAVTEKNSNIIMAEETVKEMLTQEKCQARRRDHAASR